MLPKDCNAPRNRNMGEGLGCGIFVFISYILSVSHRFRA